MSDAPALVLSNALSDPAQVEPDQTAQLDALAAAVTEAAVPAGAPTPRIEEMLSAVALLDKQPIVLSEPLAPLENDPVNPAAEPDVSLTQLYAGFRNDMRAAGLQVYDVVEDMLGLTHEGPAVNVRDPLQAQQATSAILASHALAPGLWRMYPVLAPISL